jgi:hypothetical protein
MGTSQSRNRRGNQRHPPDPSPDPHDALPWFVGS